MERKKLNSKKLTKNEMKNVLGGAITKECPEGEVWCEDANIKPRCMVAINCSNSNMA